MKKCVWKIISMCLKLLNYNHSNMISTINTLFVNLFAILFWGMIVKFTLMLVFGDVDNDSFSRHIIRLLFFLFLTYVKLNY